MRGAGVRGGIISKEYYGPSAGEKAEITQRKDGSSEY